ncbi:MAG TPA: His/Gly/Thr/Pro-type tRNA ligase C-terminal domain-containing protein, partial [Gammaproteobacteria bacterium]|nr:His/Gly/Thr/Pro-type tRNA ligase C-terminal domain-containing protein [Gammaproteobacteria bacterium]
STARRSKSRASSVACSTCTTKSIGCQPEIPYCIHRAPLSTHERFVAFLVEKFGGALPTWLSPVQLVVVPVADAQRDYAEQLVRRLRSKLVRAEVAAAGQTLARSVRDASALKVPNVGIVGRREQADGTVTLRRFGCETQLTLSSDELVRRLLLTIEGRRRDFASLDAA